MVRSSWISALVTVLACAVLACTIPLRAQEVQKESLIVIREEGKPPLKCRVLRNWQEKDGSRLSLVQAVDSGDMLTILESEPTPKAARSTAYQGMIARWGKNGTPPTGVPTPPGTMVNANSVKTSVVQSSMEPAKSGTDLRRSWGKAEPVKTMSQKTTGQQTPAKDTANRTILPVAGSDREDPLARPEVYTPGGRAIPSVLPPANEPGPATGPTISSPTVSKPQLVPAPRSGLGSFFGGQKSGTGRPTILSGVKNGPESGKVIREEVVIKDESGRVIRTYTNNGGPNGGVEKMTGSGDRPGLLSRGWGERPPSSGPSKPIPPEPRAAAQAEARKARELAEAKKDPFEEPGPKSRTLLQALGISKPQQPAAPRPMLGVMPYIAAGLIPYPSGGRMTPQAASPPAQGAGMMGATALSMTGPNAFTLEAPAQPGYRPSVPTAVPMAPYGGMTPPVMYANMGGMYPAMAGSWGYPPAMMGYTYVPVPIYYPDPAGQDSAAPGAGQALVAKETNRGPAGRATVTDLPAGSPQLLTQLRESLLPSEREMAAEQLARAEFNGEPEVVQALVNTAQWDPAPVVRVACVRALGKLKANSPPVIQAVRQLKQDKDVRVRQEVEQTLDLLKK